MEDSKHEPLAKRVPKKKSNRIPDATLGAKEDPALRFATEETGEVNAPPIVFTEQELDEFRRQEEEKEQQRLQTSSKTETYGNKMNVWVLIAKTYNDFLGWEHVTTAMQISDLGVIVCVKEAIGQKSYSTTSFVPGARFILVEDKWVIV